MRLLLWKKMKELKRTPLKVVIALLLPVILIIVYYYFLKIEFAKISYFLPFIVCCFAQIIFFNVEDLTYTPIFTAMGIRTRVVWLSNIVVLLLYGFILSNFSLFLFSFIFRESLNYLIILSNLISFVFSFTFLGLSTLHYSCNSKVEQLIASVFAILNMISPLIIFISKYIELNLNIIIILSVLCFILLVNLFIYMKKNRSEKLINNIQVYVGAYDDKFFTED